MTDVDLNRKEATQIFFFRMPWPDLDEWGMMVHIKTIGFEVAW
jgi:hypothetical protein